ncbi:MAG: hypothetical protein H8E20_14630 [Verrucomicrobia bacterium]|nr:hypothetical protein [Verrucomicrobiota bacterium]
MKNVIVLLGLVSLGAQAWSGEVASVGPNHRVVIVEGQQEEWEADVEDEAQGGEPVGGYTELVSGLHYLEGEQWIESEAVFEPFRDGVVARKGQTQVILGNNINAPGAVDMFTSDQKRLRSYPLGLAFYDRKTGRACWWQSCGTARRCCCRRTWCSIWTPLTG